MQLDIEMQTTTTTKTNMNLNSLLKALEEYDAYSPNYWKLAKYKEEFILRVKSLNEKASSQPELIIAVTNTYNFFTKKMTLEDYKDCAKTISGKASLRLRHWAMAVTVFGGVSSLLGTILLGVGLGILAPTAAPGLLVWLGLGGILGGMLIMVVGGLISCLRGQMRGVSFTMERIANTADRTGFISSTTNTL